MLHEGEFAIDERLIRNLIEAQFPKWAELELSRVESSGTVNVMHRLGDTMVVRMPQINEFSAGPEREAIWLPKFAAHLPLAIPEFVALGEPTAAYPSPCLFLAG